MSGDLFGNVAVEDTGSRAEFDFYETPAFMTLSLVQFEPRLRGARILECCSGRDAIAKVLRTHASGEVFTNDIDPRHDLAHTHEDARDNAYWLSAPAVEWVVTNPPFNSAFNIVGWALEHASVGVAFLLRKTWREPTEERGPWLAAHPPTREIGEPRYAFRGDGSDSCACDWMIWEREPDRTLPAIVIDHIAKSRRAW